MAKKPVKVVIPDEVLSRFPEEERPAMRAHLEEMFKDFDPDNPPGRPVRVLPKGVLVCLDCKGPLKALPGTMPMP